jgi:hypothetical protein
MGPPVSVLQNGPSAELDAAADELVAGDEDAAAIRLAVLLRVQPATAPAVIDLLDGVSGASLEIVRGDALRLLGRMTEAERAWARAAAAIESTGQATARRVASESTSGPAPEPAEPASGASRVQESEIGLGGPAVPRADPSLGGPAVPRADPSLGGPAAPRSDQSQEEPP